MSLLTGPEIDNQRQSGNIHISHYAREHIGANSYDLRLAPTLFRYRTPGSFKRLALRLLGRPWCLDPQKENPTEEVQIPEEGRILRPGEFYLGRTIEEAGADGFVPCIEGRSSCARLGITVHQSAGFGDDGFKSYWTLEISVMLPVKVYAGMRIAQIYFTTQEGERKPYGSTEFSGKYADGEIASKANSDYEWRFISRPKPNLGK